MKKIKALYAKYRGFLLAGVLLVMGWAALRGSENDGDHGSRASRAKMSDFDIAEAQSGKGHVLKERDFADLKAQEAFKRERDVKVQPDEKSASESKSVRSEGYPTAQPVVEPEPALADAGKADELEERARQALGPPPASRSSEAVHAAKTKEPDERRMKEEPGETRPAREKPAPRRSRPEPVDTDEEGGVVMAKYERPEPARHESPKLKPVMLASNDGGSVYGSGVYTMNPSSVTAAMDSGEVVETVGGRRTYTRGNLLKRGSEYLAIIHDAIELTGSDTQDVNVTVYGRLTAYTVTQPFVFLGKAKLSANGKRVLIDINGCTDPNANARTLPCAGVVKGLDGPDGLADKIYSPGVFPALLRTIGTAGAAFFLGKITTSVTQAGVLMDQTQSNAAWSALAAGWKDLADQAAADMAANGRTVKVYGGSVVKVFVTSDSELW